MLTGYAIYAVRRPDERIAMSLDPDLLAQAVETLSAARQLVVFTGAGISAECGIPTFRYDAGFWRRFPPEFACWNGLLRTAIKRPALLAEFLTAVLEPIARAVPGAGHHAIARLEKHVPTTIITQNVDGLHQEAGSLRVREVHGTFFKVVTRRGRFLRRLQREDLATIVRRLQKIRSGPFKLARLALAVRSILGVSWRGIHKPGVVLFGDALAEPDWTWAWEDAGLADVMVVVGTSGLVLPAAALPELARKNGAQVIAVDPHEPGPSHIWLQGLAGDILPKIVESLPDRN